MVVAAAVLDLLDLMLLQPLVLMVVMEQKHQDGLFHQLMEHQVLHPADSLLVVVLAAVAAVELELVVLVDMVEVVMEDHLVVLEAMLLQTLVVVEVEHHVVIQSMVVMVLMVLLLLDG